MVPELVEGYREAISTRRLFAGEERGVKREGDFFYPLRQAQGPFMILILSHQLNIISYLKIRF